MLQEINDPPRKFKAGGAIIKDCAHISLDPDEQVTFKIESGKEYDVARKNWGFYATPSINGRLMEIGLRTALVQNQQGKYYILLVDPDFQDDFETYLGQEQMSVLLWLDDARGLKRFLVKLKTHPCDRQQ